MFVRSRKRVRRATPNSAMPSFETRPSDCSFSSACHVFIMVSRSSGGTPASRQSPAVFSDVDWVAEGGEGGSSSSKSDSSSSASKDIPGKLTIKRSIEDVPSSLRTSSMASLVWAQRRSAGMFGR